MYGISLKSSAVWLTALLLLHNEEEDKMLDINISDVINVLRLCAPYLIALGIAVVAAITVIIAVRKKQEALRSLLRGQAVTALALALVIIANLICFGPMSTLLTLISGEGVITEATGEEAKALAEQIAEEGIVLLENKEGFLPLSGISNLNIFGWSSVNPCYGGTGSGSLNASYPLVSLLEGLENAGFNLNAELSGFYTAYRVGRPVIGIREADWTLPEPPVDTYPIELLENARNFSNTALVVITRVGGEGLDLPQDLSVVTFTDNSTRYREFESGGHYLELSRSERDMLNLVCNNFNDVVVVYNGANAFEFGFIQEYEQIKGLLWCPGAGQTGFNGLGAILKGVVNPSGKTPDTFVYDMTNAPWYNNIGNFPYDNMEEHRGKDSSGTATFVPSFVNYVEGIYVGYRFYETAAEERAIDYGQTVLYPFGYGLSYTGFSQSMGDLRIDGQGNIAFDVTVTNTGSVAGKEVVEVYYTPPYTNGGIEKASVNLVAFDKTSLLQPSASETLNIRFKAEDMASYDAYGAGAYVLEAGNYRISIRSDSHTILDSRNYNLGATIVYGGNNKRSTDTVAAENRFSAARGEINYMSRANHFANYAETAAAPSSRTLSAQYKSLFLSNVNYDPSVYNDPSDVMPVTGVRNNLTLANMRGRDYDDSSWEPLLDQLTVDDMTTLISLAGYQTVQLPSVGKYATMDCDGPASINNYFTRVGSIGFPSIITLGCTWNDDLALAYGELIGKMADEMNTSGWYAPAMNIHRSAFAGRNFEYYSEDGLLSGKLAAQAVIGAEKYGVYSYVKHFALNDQEQNRNRMLCTWSTEQAIREIYLKPFEIAVKEGKTKAIMSAYNYIGIEWAGGSDALLNKVLRDEWGFRGFVLTDYFGVYGHMNADLAVRNGNDAMLVSYQTAANSIKDRSATSVKAMRQASKNIMYTVVNSRAYRDAGQSRMPSWQVTAIIINVILLIVLAAAEFLMIRSFQSKVHGIQTLPGKKNNP
jgi:beta-glucosidase